MTGGIIGLILIFVGAFMADEGEDTAWMWSLGGFLFCLPDIVIGFGSWI